MKLSRRNFLTLSAASLLAGPPLLRHALADETKTIKLVLGKEQRQWFGPSGEPVKLWGFDRDVLRLRQGEPVEIEVENRLPQPSSVHWHGLRVENAMDGVTGLTQVPIEPGERFLYRFTPQDAGTFWAHSHHRTYEQLARGLYLPLIVEERTAYPVDQDMVLALDDWRLGNNGQLHTESFGDMHEWAHGGRTGNLLTTNRQLKPAFEVRAGERMRLRLLNTANARIMLVKLPSIPTWIIAKDGQPLAEPQPLSEPLVLAPAERYDLVVDIPAQNADRYTIRDVGLDEPVELASLQVTGKAEKRWFSPPKALAANPLPEPGSGEPDHRLQLDMTGGAMGNLRQAVYQGETLGVKELIQKHQIWAFNGVANMPEQPMLDVKRGDLVEIEILNNTRWPHGMHLHGHHFKADLARYPKGIWHDTLAMAGGERSTIRFRADNPGSWLLHCHMIEHQAAGMVTWIRVAT
ncbi:multicopper oxidase family protein [Marinobacterium sp. AK62]|uniref:Multicopper oxidase family protein n=1 Tax=Marinobacterium alkalitolerans TaxID=1542925 RepID=A0ABS3ZA81_9GAMM|nr:multicopper oxidase family protein [Marinobacterium alkalitolerans]MBP0048572.1 multicopper oxidase family protein [Marinobacterium alkalitolerans]